MIAPSTPRTPQIPKGTYLAIPYKLMYLGIQKSEGQWGVKYQPKVSITFEFPTETAEFEDKTTGVKAIKPKVVSQIFTFTMSDMGNLLPIVEGIVGGLSEDEAKTFDLDSILGVPCQVQVEVVKDRSKIKTTMPLMKGTTAPEQFNKNNIVRFDTITDEDLAKQPQFLKEMITYAKEYAKDVSAMNDKPVVRKKEQGSIDYGEDINPDDIPF